MSELAKLPSEHTIAAGQGIRDSVEFLGDPLWSDAQDAECDVGPPEDHVTNAKFIFLREIGEECLVPFLEDVVAANASGAMPGYWGGTLIIDQFVELRVPITIPAWFTVAGVGVNGAGRLRFLDLGSEPAVRFQEVPGASRRGHSNLRDIAIEGLGGCERGLLVRGGAGSTGNHFLDRVLIHGFSGVGVEGAADAYYIHLRDCIIGPNGTNVVLNGDCNGWRFVGCTIHRAEAWGLQVVQALNDLVISGCRFERNAAGGVYLQGSGSFGVMIVGNSFEDNNGLGVRVGAGAESTRIVCNAFAHGDEIDGVTTDPGPADTQIGFNASDQFPAIEVLEAFE